MKILSPVGNFESLKAAIASGADEIYLGINNFNARNTKMFISSRPMQQMLFIQPLSTALTRMIMAILFGQNPLKNLF